MRYKYSRQAFVGVGVVAAALVFTLTWHHAHATEPSFPKVTELSRIPLSEVEGKEVRIIELQFGPGADSPPHRHPGDVFVYVVEGELVTEVNDDPPFRTKAGGIFHEPAMALHKSTRNPSETEGARAIAFMVMDKDEPTTVMHKP